MKTLSLTNLDRITELDFDRTSSANAVGGTLSLTKLKNLIKLKASYNDLSKVSFSTTDNTTVEELNISNNAITALTNIGSLNGLTSLNVSNNQIASVPNIGNLTGLTLLDISNNQFTTISSNIGSLTNVETLNLSSNQFTTVPVISALTSLKTLNLSNNSLTVTPTGVFDHIANFTSLETLNLSNNDLSQSEVDSALSILDTDGLNSGTINLGGTNSLPSLGNYNAEKLSLETKGWTVTINGGIDSSFTTAEGYSNGPTSNHPDWEGSTHWQTDIANNKITVSSPYKNIRTSNRIQSRVGSTINVSANFDYGNNALTADTNQPVAERSLLIALVDIGAFSQGESHVLDQPNLALMTKFQTKYNDSTPRMKLYQKFDRDAESLSEIIGNNPNWQPLAAATGNKFTLTVEIQIGASKEASTVTVTITNDDDLNSLTGTYNLSDYADMYSSLVSSTSNVKLHIQSGELIDNNIDKINVYSTSARVN